MKWFWALFIAFAFTLLHADNAYAATMQLSVVPNEPLVAGTQTHLTFTLTRMADSKPVTLDALKEVHTQKLHLLVIDPSLSDYQHLHPAADSKPGQYSVDFTPMKSGSYRVWADVTPLDSSHEYVMTDIGGAITGPGKINKAVSPEVDVEGYRFALTFDATPVEGQAVMGHIEVTKDKAPFTKLETVMGAYAHVVAFPEDLQSVVHVHPVGKEPAGETDRGGPKLDFHLEPVKAGFIKLYAQVRIDGRDIFAPFGVMVKPAVAK